MMILAKSAIDDITNACASTSVDSQHDVLLQKLKQILPELPFVHVLTRGGWHRTGGVLNREGERIADNLRDWLEIESSGDINKLIDQYVDTDFIVTSFVGKTHYFVAQTGESAQDYVQLEVEELQEIKDHALFSQDALPDDIEDMIDPVDMEKLPADPVGEPRYMFRRITPVDNFMQLMSEHMMVRGNKYFSIQRFMHDWDRSSAKETGPFCHHWVLSLQEYTDAYGEPIMQAKPVSTFEGDVPLMKLNGVHRGSQLAVLVHGFDHDIGYPMAWYFYMLSHREVPHKLAEAIHKDLMGAYAYLPAKDLKVLKDWTAKPYGI